MLIPAESLVSKCCKALIVMDGEQYQCVACAKHCQSGGTLADLAEPKQERQRLEREVVKTAKAYESTVREYIEYASACMLTDYARSEESATQRESRLRIAQHDLLIAVCTLLSFEAEHDK